MTGPLEGVKVLDISTILAGPLVAQILGDFGAEVIKIEHPTKPDGMRGHGLDKDGHPLWWTMISRNKRTMTLNLGNERGAEIFRRLAAEADVVVENFRPGTLERWGLGYDVLSEVNPGLILLRVTGFGQTGPYSTRPAFGTLVESMSGFAHLTGEADGPPTLPAFGLADSLAGIAGSSAVSMALLHRTNNGGKGQVIDLDLLSPIMAAVGPGVIYADQLGIDQERTGNRSSNNAPRNLYKTADGHWLAISTSANSIAERVLVLVGHPEVLDEPWFATGRQRAAHADLLDDYVGGWIAERTRDVVIDEFEKAGAAVAPVYKPSELLSDPQVNAIEMVTTVEDDDLGPVRMQNVMWRMGGSPGRIRHTGRRHGADTDVVLSELGCTADEIEAMRRDSVV
ncbi:crotonobetainyl-CoA:carnitine CoA-transferase CaiB-like acyl-CoA transferase [Rhodococcus fascians]|uniref:CaiB/BaiF CoA transferase family protein n=1 Tax=Nocardiaceae TaxID=85025 RepID=UPI000B9AFEFF|nr:MULTISPECIES: CoA transferase [Rhodococcus]RZL77613.1 MAG: CoA transferase [Rhodococcus sp. (in: high G+C Gram-positive bacteria)]MBY4209003.1 CoA transferase [Rhodococcus fascians]MBY4230104.1 CoA transferase [Rhodococcus fascians]MDR6912843.1 crotonobetainyl-CoA:carnitine CoA-transferase CaiB-like acyl-CoA transferase [Rhodococcus sp. 3258]MDR6934475.1 crotonobetainyl-CoA:carnitine CoA-transferase CaiB-like acyl-CoA transferase [Rhodococcus fascians]